MLEKFIHCKTDDSGNLIYSYDFNEILKMPEFRYLEACEQNDKWHAEGNVLVHTKMVCEEALKVVNEEKVFTDKNDIMVFLGGALFHDIGKYITTKKNKRGDWSAYGHDIVGEKITRNILWGEEVSIREQICLLVKYHMKILTIWDEKDFFNSYINIIKSGVNVDLLCELKKCDNRGSINTSDKERDLSKIKYFKEYSNLVLELENKRTELKVDDVFRKIGVMMIGLPGSGKSTFVKKFFSKDCYIVHSRDEIRKRLGFPNKCNDADEKKVTKIFEEELMHTLNIGATPVIDNTNLSKKYRNAIKERCKGFDIEWVYVYTETKDINTNIKRRKGEISPEVIKNMAYRLDFPEKTEYDRMEVYISSNNNFKK